MKLRLVAALLLMLIAVGLPLAAMSKDGPPWGFRGHQAVVVGVAGTVEATASEQRQQHTNAIDDKLDVAPNLHLDAGDKVRVARLGEARLRFPSANVVVGDGASLLVGVDGVTLSRGVVTATLLEGAEAFTVVLDAGGTIRGKGAGAVLIVLADGKGGAQARVENGSAEARTARGDRELAPGKVLRLSADDAVLLDKPTSLDISATCAATKLNVVAPAQTQIFAAGTLAYPDVAAGADTGSAILDVEAGSSDVFVLGRNVFGQVGQARAACDKRK
jgi:hypothetical protein